MDEQTLKRIPALKDLPIFDEADEAALAITQRDFCEMAETDDSVRVHELVHRSEYKPVAAVRRPNGISVYFEMCNHSGVAATP